VPRSFLLQHCQRNSLLLHVRRYTGGAFVLHEPLTMHEPVTMHELL
jgi:lipoate-protein ligase A